MLGCYNLMALGSIIKFQGGLRLRPCQSHTSHGQRWTFRGNIRFDPWSHELKHADRQPASGHLGMWATLLGSFREEQKEHQQLMDVPRQFHQQTPTDHSETSRGYTYPHWCMSWFKMSSLFTRLQILNHTPQTCFQQPALRGWTGALRCAQGRRDVSRKNWCLMVWKWIQFGVPDSHHLRYEIIQWLGGFALTQETLVCQNMSKHATCRSGLRCLFYSNLLSCTKLKVFWSAFWDGRTYATLSGMSHCHTIQSLALHEHSGGRPRGGIGAAAHFESSEARLMWSVRLMVSKQILPPYHWVVNGLNESNRSETY